MEGSSATSPLGEPTVPIIANCIPTLSAVESVNSAQNQVCSDATSIGEINSPMLLIDDSSTPKKKQSFSQEGSLYKPQCHEELKPKVGMLFDDIGSVLEFYRTYAPLAGLLRTTSISESANSFFKRFICRKLSFVEFWLRFDTALKCQRQNELIANNTSEFTTSELLTSWEIEKQGREVFTHEIFDLFQAQVLAARDDCDVQNTTNGEGVKVMSVSDQYNKIREVCYDTTTMVAKCSCKLFESKGIVCRHIIRVLRGAKINELPSIYVLKRWEKNCKRDIMFDGEGNVLEENFIDPADMAVRRKISAVRNKLEDLIRTAKCSMEGIEFLHTSLCKAELGLSQQVPVVPCSTQENEESFIGSIIPKDVTILTPIDTNARGTCSRIKGHRDGVRGGSGDKKRRLGIHQKVARKCSICKKVVFHDARTCSMKNMT